MENKAGGLRASKRRRGERECVWRCVRKEGSGE